MTMSASTREVHTMHDHGTHTKLILAAVVGFAVLAVLGVPVLSYLPLLAILAICPLMMMFMMRRMGQDSDTTREDRPAAHRH